MGQLISVDRVIFGGVMSRTNAKLKGRLTNDCKYENINYCPRALNNVKNKDSEDIIAGIFEGMSPEESEE